MHQGQPEPDFGKGWCKVGLQCLFAGLLLHNSHIPSSGQPLLAQAGEINGEKQETAQAPLHSHYKSCVTTH